MNPVHTHVRCTHRLHQSKCVRGPHYGGLAYARRDPVVTLP